jgi:putative DNA methylase
MTSTNNPRKKLIEVAIPLEAINAASAREKSIRHGHPSTLHLWWARRPLAACRAVLFAQLVDDPSGYTEKLLDDPKIRKQAEADLAVRLMAWRERKADAQGNVPETPEPTLADCAADIERKRLFEIIEELVLWENSTNEEVLERARAEIRRSCGGSLPSVYDPFSGGGSIPLEAQRLGLPAYGSDLNPVAVMIGKAMIEIPPKFKDQPPIHPGIKSRTFYRNAEGLAEDVKYYGEWMREKAWERIGQHYPQVELPKEHGGGKGQVIAWIWARTIESPDPSLGGRHVPLTKSFELSSRPGRAVWIEPVVTGTEYEFRVRSAANGDKGSAPEPTVGRTTARCLISNTAFPLSYVREKAIKGELGKKLMAIVVEGRSGRIYLPPSYAQSLEVPEVDASHLDLEIDHWRSCTNCVVYGMTKFADLFSDRQIFSLSTFSDLLGEVQAEISTQLASSGVASNRDEYGEAIATYLAFVLDKCADYWSSLCSWNTPGEKMRNTFGRQALPMVWDYAEANPFSSSSGNWSAMVDWVCKVIAGFVPGAQGTVLQKDAQSIDYSTSTVISTDPPYYDNIPYSNLSDFFYVWLRKSVRRFYPDLLSTISVPRMDELVANQFRFGGRDNAQQRFLDGMRAAIHQMASTSSSDFPATIYYAFKQSEIQAEGISSTGWATFLQAIMEAGYSVVGTWPMRTEMSSRMMASGTNALANSVVLVCRKREAEADTITRAEFIRALKRELPSAIGELQAANIAPADMPQSAIGPGMGVFSRYKAVIEADDSPMSVKTALQLINAELDEYLGGIQGEFDPDTRFTITWYEQNGMGKGDYGIADNLARARGISVESVKHAGIVESAAGKVRILARDELADDWDPDEDRHLTVWECLQHLVRKHEKDGISYDTAVLLKKIGARAEAVKDLAYCLYDICANKRKDAKEATAFNALIADWTELTRQAAAIHDTSGDRQARLNI